MNVALTVQDVEQLQATTLKLVHRKLQALPQGKGYVVGNQGCSVLLITDPAACDCLHTGLAKLTQLTSIDASDNPITDLPACDLPHNLKELNLTGCQLIAVPQCLSSLTNLLHLQLAANRVSQADSVFHIPYLLHAGLGYNCISGLPVCSSADPAQRSASPDTDNNRSSPNRNSQPGKQPTQSCNSSSAGASCSNPSNRGASPVPQHTNLFKQQLTNSRIKQPPSSAVAAQNPTGSPSIKPTAHPCSCRSPLMSLDLSHNNITDLPAVLQQLQQLSQLKSLSLRGNPVSMLPCYQEVVLQCLPQLLYLDGQVSLADCCS